MSKNTKYYDDWCVTLQLKKNCNIWLYRQRRTKALSLKKKLTPKKNWSRVLTHKASRL